MGHCYALPLKSTGIQSLVLTRSSKGNLAHTKSRQRVDNLSHFFGSLWLRYINLLHDFPYGCICSQIFPHLHASSLLFFLYCIPRPRRCPARTVCSKCLLNKSVTPIPTLGCDSARNSGCYTFSGSGNVDKRIRRSQP